MKFLMLVLAVVVAMGPTSGFCAGRATADPIMDLDIQDEKSSPTIRDVKPETVSEDDGTQQEY